MSDIAPLALWRPPGELRRKLTEMRDDLIDRMVRRGTPEPAFLPQLAGIAAAIEAIDRAARTQAAALAAVDDSSAEIRLLVYRNGDAIAATELEATTAIRLGGELLAAAGERLASDLALLREKDSR